MSEQAKDPKGPDLAKGVPVDSIADGTMLQGHVEGEAMILARRGDAFYSIGAQCTHYGAPLADGLLVGDTVRCPWHHASFSLRNGQAQRAPALQDVSCRRVERRGDMVYVGERVESTAARRVDESASGLPSSVVIVGGGAAGHAAAVQLRSDGYQGPVTILSADTAPPYDRPSLSKESLSGGAALGDLDLRPPQFYQDRQIDVRLKTEVKAIDVERHRVQLDSGEAIEYGALLLATGATPVKLDIPGADAVHVHYLRSRSDCDALIAAAKVGARAVVIGSSFIGLEVAASLRARKLDVHVIGRETVLMERVLGAQVGEFLKRLHEQHGVVFHLGTTPTRIETGSVSLANGESLPADLVVIGVGVQPAIGLAEQAGLALDRGVQVDQYLATSSPGVFAAGDIARWPDRLSEAPIRVEHWVVAGRMGQCAARNMLGKREAFDMVPLFWTEQYDFGLAYVGHAEGFDDVQIDGDLDKRDCKISYRRKGKLLAVAVVHRDLDGLRSELEFERQLAGAQ